MIDPSLISLCKKGNRNAHAQTYNACIPYVYSITKRYIYNQEDIKDVIQEIFANVFTKIDSFDSEKGSWNTWIRKITVNQCLLHLRKNKKLSLLNPIDEAPAQSIDESKILDQLSREDIDKMLANMPTGYKIVFMLNVIDGYNHSEISDTLQISKETSRSQLNRAKKWLKNQITKDHKYQAYGLF